MSKNVADFFIDCNEFISPYLVKIFNYIFDKGIYPETWCYGAIVPIFKKGDKHVASNYRGITLVNIIAKIFQLHYAIELILGARMIIYLIHRNSDLELNVVRLIAFLFCIL